MAQRLLILLSVATLALGQSSSMVVEMSSMVVEITPSPSMSPSSSIEVPMMTPTPTPEVTTGPPTTDMMPATDMPPTTDMMPTTEIPIEDQINRTLAERYQDPRAMIIRSEHFFCLEIGGEFPMDDISGDSITIYNNFAIFLQYPLLAYLDSVKKMFLMRQIVNIINAGGTIDPPLNASELCIGEVFHYDVSLYTESVLINIYLGDPSLNNRDINTIFTALSAGINQPDPRYIRLFGSTETPAIIIGTDTYGEILANVHPGAFRQGGVRFAPETDPVLNAVILGYWLGRQNLTYVTSNPEMNASVTARLVPNPNPVEQGLTGGDIVFIIIATLLCVLLAGLMVFGYCIQPLLM